MLLASVCFLDELSSGVPFTGSAAIRDELETSYSTLSLVLLVLPTLSGLLLEAPLLLYAERLPRSRATALSLAATAAAMVLLAASHPPWMVALAMSLWAPAAGVACGMAQASLVDGDPQQSEQRLAQWTLAGVLGDLLAPVLLAMLALGSASWRYGLLLSAALSSLVALAFSRVELPAAAAEAEEERPPIRAYLRRYRLLAWLLAGALCALLDEVLVSFAVLRVRDQLGGDTLAASAMCVAFTAGGAVSLMLLPRVLARAPAPRVLAYSSALCALAYSAWLLAGGLAVAIALMGLVGVFAAPLYPLVRAQAYRHLPGRSVVVNALGVLFSPLDLLIPLGLGLVADRFGVLAALALLLAQPLGILLVLAVAPGRGADDEVAPPSPGGDGA